MVRSIYLVAIKVWLKNLNKSFKNELLKFTKEEGITPLLFDLLQLLIFFEHWLPV